MIGKLDPEKRRVVVVGGGISGLLSAYYLMKAGYQIKVVEKTQRLGGLMHTSLTPFGMAEASVHSLLVNSRVKSLFDELGLELIPVSEASRARFIWRAGKMHKFPLSIIEGLGLIWRILIKRAPTQPFKNLQEWGEHFLGKAATRFLLDPFLRGVYAASPSKISPAAVLGDLNILPGKSFLSVLLAFRRKKQAPEHAAKMMTLKGGMGTLVTALVRELKSKPTQVQWELGREFKTQDLVALRDSNIVMTAPAYAVERVTGLKLGIRYSPMVSVTVFFREDDFKVAPPQGVGVLVPECERDLQVLGILFNSSSFEKRVALSVGKRPLVSLTVMLGGAGSYQILDQTDEALIQTVTQDCARLLGTVKPPTHCQIHRWPLGIPQYDHSVLELGSKIEKQMAQSPLKPGLVFFGNYTGEVSLRGMIQDAQDLLK